MEIGLPVQASQAVDLLANDIADKQETEETAPDTSKIIDSISKALADADSVADALNAMKSSVESDNELNSKPQDILNLVHTLETSCNDIFKASGIDSTPSSDHGDLGGTIQL